jgi:tRNA threonylcarbamoyladenosine biosynthesis protein TsaE
MHTFISRNPTQTKKLAKKIRDLYPNHNLFLLSGDLGSGKTVFAKGIGEMMGINSRNIKSPTYTLVHEHKPVAKRTALPKLLHADFYRLTVKDDLLMESVNLWLSEKGIVIVEWPEIALSDFQKPHLHITIEETGENVRQIKIIERL